MTERSDNAFKAGSMEGSGKVIRAGSISEGSGKNAKAAGIAEGFKKLLRWLWEDETPNDGLTPEEREETRRANRCGFRVLYRKELADHLSGKRFQVLFLLLLLVSAASLYGAVGTLQEASKQAQAMNTAEESFHFLKLFTTAGSGIYSFSTFLSFLGPVFGIMLGFDAINNEKAQGTLNRLAAQPIYRDTIINAKFLAGATVIALTVFSIGGLMAGAGLLMSGIVPQAEEWARLAVYLFMAAVYISLWLAIAMLFSVLSKHAATSALFSIALWLFLTMFLSLAANAVASLVYSGAATTMDLIGQYRLDAALNRISPYYLFAEVTSVLMNPNVRSLDIMSVLEYQNGAVISYLTLGQSLLQIWPHLVAMIAEALAGFTAAYIAFMKQEIRA